MRPPESSDDERAGTARTRQRSVVAALALVILFGGSVAGGATARAHTAAAKPVLRVAFTGEPNSPNPAKAAAEGSLAAPLYSLAYAPLFHIRPDGSIAPALAVSWHYFKTGTGPNKGFEFTLRSGARFSDGTPVTARAVANWLKYYADGGTQFASALGPEPKFIAVNRRTVRLRLTVPTPNLPRTLSEAQNWGFVASPRAVATPSLFSTRTYGAGPYMLNPSRSVAGDHYTYVPNPHYYDKSAVKFSGVEVRIIPTSSTRLQALQSSQLDVAEGDASTAGAASSAGFRVVWAPSSVLAFWFNYAKTPASPLVDVRVRQAINYAIDRKTVTQATQGSFGQPTSSVIVSDIDANLASSYPYNPSRARSLLAAAGLTKGFDLEMLVPAGLPLFVQVGQALAKYLDTVGIHVDIKISTDYVNDIFSYKYATFVGYAPIGPTPPLFNTMLSPKSPANFFGGDATINGLYYAGLRAANPAPYWTRMWQRATGQAYFLPVMAQPTMYFASKRVSGVTVTAKRGFFIPTEWRATAKG